MNPSEIIDQHDVVATILKQRNNFRNFEEALVLCISQLLFQPLALSFGQQTTCGTATPFGVN